MKKQILFIHGGSTFDTHKDYLRFLRRLKIDLARYRKTRWSDSLQKNLGNTFDVLSPKMPNNTNAKYNEWKILFQKIAPLLHNRIILIGHSLGGIFLAKYLSENNFPKKILATLLIAAPYDNKNMEESLGDFTLPKNLRRFSRQGGKIFLYHSKDDKVVPYAHLEKYKNALPNATIRTFRKKGHFIQAKFPELVKDIKSFYSPV